MPLDASSLAPDLCPGAQTGTNAALAVALLERLAQEPPRAHPVFFAFLDANAIRMRGMREMLATLATTTAERRAPRQKDQQLLAEYSHDADLLHRLQAAPDPLAALGRAEFRDLHPFIKDVASIEITAIDTELQPLRLEAFHATGGEKTDLQAQIDRLAERRAHLNAARTQMMAPPTRDGRSRLDADLVSLAQDLLNRAARRVEKQCLEAHARDDAEKRRAQLRREVCDALGMPPESERPLGFVLGLSLSDEATYGVYVLPGFP